MVQITDRMLLESALGLVGDRLGMMSQIARSLRTIIHGIDQGLQPEEDPKQLVRKVAIYCGFTMDEVIDNAAKIVNLGERDAKDS